MTVGTPIPHDAALMHVTGQARYLDDLPAPSDCVHLCFGLSPAARGSITAIDVAAVRRAPGVVAVWTAADFDPVPDCATGTPDEPLLAPDRVQYLGQPVFLVAATSHLAARRAARLGKVTVNEEPPILSYEEALAADSRFEEGPRIWTKGDTAAMLAAAPRRLHGRVEMGGQEHFYLEGQAALALPGEDGQMVVHASTQHPTEIQHKVADALGVPMSSVRVECRRMGGGFGGKESQGNWLAVACAVAARRLNRPARMRYDRDDDITITGKRHDFRIDYDVGYDDTGRIWAVDFRQYLRCGWSQDLSLPVGDRAMLHADNAYDIAAMRIESHRLKTNMQSATAFRGFGGPQGIVGIERVIDQVAHELGLDPLEVRKRNFYADMQDGNPVLPPDLPAPAAGAPARTQTTPYHQKIEDFCLHALVAQLERSCDYAARRQQVAEWNAAHRVLKKGIALTPVKFGISFTQTSMNQAGALVLVYRDGSILMSHGGTEMGQGLYRKVSQVAADRFGVPIELVRLAPTDTGRVPNTSATSASTGSDLNGMAVQDACDQIRARIARLVAERHQARPEDVVFAGGMVRVGGDEMPFAAAVDLAYQNRVSLSATGFYKTPDLEWDRINGRGRPFYYFAHGAACSEVVLDTLTGESRILRADILHDCGDSLNPAVDRGQIEGAYVQGAGWLTMEELVWDQRGLLRTHAPSTYKIPACSDRPPVFNVAFWKQPNRMPTVYRSKAVGEPPFLHGVSAFLALSAAVAAARGDGSYPALDAPATPERLLAAISR